MILVLVLTAPIWLALGGILLGIFGGIIGGIFGAIFGIFGAIVGAFFGIIMLPFKLLFDSCDPFDGGLFHFSGKGILILCLVVLVVAAAKRR